MGLFMLKGMVVPTVALDINKDDFWFIVNVICSSPTNPEFKVTIIDNLEDLIVYSEKYNEENPQKSCSVPAPVRIPFESKYDCVTYAGELAEIMYQSASDNTEGAKEYSILLYCKEKINTFELES